MSDIAENLQKAAEALSNNGVAQPRREAASLMAFALKKDKSFLIAHSDYLLTSEESDLFCSLVNRRSSREPFQYITGKQEFYGLEFTVAPGVLIPRPETEIIVENAIRILQKSKDRNFCEIGTGSGCIAISILHEIKTSTAFAVDISKEALQTAEKNAAKHNVKDRLKLKQSDIFSAFDNEKFALIVSNPPYIPCADIKSLQSEVRDFEPHVALTDGANGLYLIKKIVTQSPKFLKNKSILLMEIGFSQSFAVREMFLSEIWESVEIISDLQGIPRTVKAVLK